MTEGERKSVPQVMADKLNEEIERLSRIDYYQPANRIRRALKMISALRTRLESIEAARRDAQESRFALIIENEALVADLADASARLESAEAALERCVSLADPGDVADADYCAACANVQKTARAALGAAGEENTNG